MSASFLWTTTLIVCAIDTLPVYGKPVYPLYGIDAGHDSSNLTEQDIKTLANNFEFLQCHYSTAQLTSLHLVNSVISPVSYINSDSVSASDVEHTDRYGASFYVVGHLTESITATDTAINIDILSKTAYLKASTSTSNYSTSCNDYAIFIRVHHELMKVTQVSALNNKQQQTVHVVRGFNGSTASAYNANAKVFHPVYDGGSYPDGSGQQITYIVDPTQSYSKQRLIQHTVQAVKSGYNGSWFDCFSAVQYNAVDQCGNHLTDTWSFELNTYFNRSTLAQANQQRLTYVLNETKQTLGDYPVITANNVANSYFADQGDCKSFLKQDSNVNYKTNLNGYCLEAFAGNEVNDNPYHDGCPPNGAGLVLQWQSYNTWLRHVQEVMDASQHNLAIMPMIAQAGCKAIALEVVPSAERDAFEQFAYASFLLGVESMHGNSRLGLSPFYQNENQTRRYAYVHPRYYWKIGNPVETYHYENITKYQINGKHTFRRYFENGMILVNPTNDTDKNIALNHSYYNPNTEQWIKTIDCEAQRGYILLNSNDTQYVL